MLIESTCNFKDTEDVESIYIGKLPAYLRNKVDKDFDYILEIK